MNELINNMNNIMIPNNEKIMKTTIDKLYNYIDRVLQNRKI